MFNNTRAFSGFSVNDIEAAKKFYEGVLGLQVEQDTRGISLKLAGGNNIFLYPKPDHVPATYTTLNFMVDYVDQVVDELAAKGIVFEKYEGMHQDAKGIARGIAADKGPDMAWFKDPAGNILSILQER